MYILTTVITESMLKPCYEVLHHTLSLSSQRGLLEVMYDIFRLPVPVVTQDFIEALLSVGECGRCLLALINIFISRHLPHQKSTPIDRNNVLCPFSRPQ